MRNNATSSWKHKIHMNLRHVRVVWVPESLFLAPEVQMNETCFVDWVNNLNQRNMFRYKIVKLCAHVTAQEHTPAGHILMHVVLL